MSEEISNKTLAALLVIAIVVSLGGTMMSMNKLGTAKMFTITARGTIGTAAINITEDTTINVTQTSVNFGDGKVNSDQSSCTLATNDSSAASCGTWDNYFGASEAFAIENLGNVDVNVTVTAGADADGFLGGTSPTYKYAGVNKDGSACSSGLVSSWTDFSTSATSLCQQLNSGASEDELYIHVQVKVPDDASGYKTDTITFTSVKSGTQS